MSDAIDRRLFLKALPGAAAVAQLATPQSRAPEPEYPAIGAARYPVRGDYPMRAKSFSEVKVTDGFWAPKIATNAATTIPFLIGRDSGGGLSRNVLEAAIYTLQTHPNPALQSQVEARIEALSRSIESRTRPSNEFFEVAVAWYNATGKRTLLDQAIKVAAALYEDFRVNKPPFTGGERDATNCLQLYRVTRDRRHLDLAKHYLDIRGLPSSLNRSRHNQSYKPVLEQSEAVGHAVNGVTMMVALADTGTFTGLATYFEAAKRMWTDAATRKMYVTGGVGSTGNEGFGEPYALPNISAYAETCAVLMFMTLNHRLFLASGNSKYIDVLERGLYNNSLSGVSPQGDHFFYVNRLASAGDGRDLRWQRASLECCPPNLVRFLATMPGYIYAQDASSAVYVNLYVSSEATFKVRAQDLTLRMESDMPWGGKSTLTFAAAAPTRASVKLRVPGWAQNRPTPGGLYSYTERSSAAPTFSVNGKSTPAVIDQLGYATLDRVWRNGDTVEIAFTTEPRRVVAHQRVRETRGRVAIERGPIVFCAEWPDCPDGDALDLQTRPAAPLKTATDPTFGGITVLDTMAGKLSDPEAAQKPVRLIPYYLWANRGAGEMSVWIATRELQPGDTGPAGGLIFHVNPNYKQDGWRYLEAAPFDQSAGATWGCFRRLLQGARGTAVGTGKQNTADILSACNDPNTAAALCSSLSLNGITGWFLPSRDESSLMYAKLVATSESDFGMRGVADNFTYWTSTQQTADMAHHIDFADLGRPHYDDKDFPRRVRAIRAF
jgi:DUF1680 family protein